MIDSFTVKFHMRPHADFIDPGGLRRSCPSICSRMSPPPCWVNILTGWSARWAMGRSYSWNTGKTRVGRSRRIRRFRVISVVDPLSTATSTAAFRTTTLLTELLTEGLSVYIRADARSGAGDSRFGCRGPAAVSVPGLCPRWLEFTPPTDRPPIVVPPTVLVQPPPEAWERAAECREFQEGRIGLDRFRSRGPVAQRAMRTDGVVLAPPLFDEHLRLLQRIEDFPLRSSSPSVPLKLSL